MKKSTSTKRALTMSVVSFLVCVAVFIGSTFAWFTDSASVNVSSIRSGKLDIGLEMSEDGVTWTDAATKGQVLEFVKDDGAAANRPASLQIGNLIPLQPGEIRPVTQVRPQIAGITKPEKLFLFKGQQEFTCCSAVIVGIDSKQRKRSFCQF